MLLIKTGYECMDQSDCDKKCKCKYSCKSNKFFMNIHSFLKNNLHIKLPRLISFSKLNVQLSGTELCPYHKSRNYTCWDCKYQSNLYECKIMSYDRKDYIPKDGWSKCSRCGSFEKSEISDNYKNGVENKYGIKWTRI